MNEFSGVEGSFLRTRSWDKLKCQWFKFIGGVAQDYYISTCMLHACHMHMHVV